LVETEGQIGEYQVLGVLGEGQFSVVKRCRKLASGIGSGHGHGHGHGHGSGDSECRDSHLQGHDHDHGHGHGVGAAAVGVISNLISSETSRQFAVKQIAKDKIRNITEVLRIEHELHALKLCSPHANVTRYVEAMHGLGHIYIVTEMLPLDLVSITVGIDTGCMFLTVLVSCHAMPCHAMPCCCYAS
jgi:serine/threonine protein kinase